MQRGPTKPRRRVVIAARLAGALLAAVWAGAAALDLGPLDGIAPPSGIGGVSLALGERSLSGSLDIHGIGPIGARVERRNANLRLGHGFELIGMPAYAYGELPLVDYRVAGEVASQFDLDPGKGPGDIALALAAWPHADRANGSYFAMAGYVIAPTGEYEASRTLGANLNPGGNRYAGILQAGGQQRIGTHFEWNLAADVMFFGDNDAYIGGRVVTNHGRLQPADPATLEVKPYISYQSSLAWRPHRAVTLAASYYIDRGAESRVDGGEWGASVNRERYGLWGLFALSPRTRLNISYKRPIDDQSALELDDALQIRLVRFF